MFFERAARILLTTVILIQCQILVMAAAYSQVSSSGSGNGDGPKIYKALNFDLVFPKSFNSSENVISTTPAVPAPSVVGSGSAITDVVVDGGRQQQQNNPLPQSNEQTNRDAVGDDIVDDGDKRPLYVTPSPNEPALYGAHGAGMDSSNRKGINNGNDAQVVTVNPINIQRQQPQPQRQQLNDKNNNYNAAEEQQNIATGRAVDYHTGYPFGQLITPLIKNAPRPVYSSSQGKPVAAQRPSSSSSLSLTASNVGKMAVYPQAVYHQKPPNKAEIDKFHGKGPFRDRFTPSEAVASHQLKSGNHNHNHHHHNHAPSYTGAVKIPASSNVVNSYVAPKNLYSFPPNNANYPLPGQDYKLGLPTNVVNSYSPPPSGPLKDAMYPLATASSNDNGYKYAGPLSLGYLPAINNNKDNGDSKDQMDNSNGNGDDDGGGNGADADNGDLNDSIGVLPASALDGIDNSNDMNPMQSMAMKDENSNDDPHDDHSYDTEKEYPTPPPEWLKAHPEAAQEHPPHDHDHDHNEHHHDDPQPEIEFDHDHDHHHHHHHPDIILDHDSHSYPYHSFPSFPVYHHYPETIYDDHHDHHHIESPPPTTTEAPLPEPPQEPPQEPRVKKYSYFYIGRKLWYIPLYFTVWFSFYVLWLILKSIARHKVNLPNHYVSRRSVENYNLSKRQQEIINQLTVSILEKIENFKRRNVN